MFETIALGLYGPICFAMGYYVSHRGLIGVKNDLMDIKMDVTNLKAKLPNATVA